MLNNILKLILKSQKIQSNLAVVGIYLYVINCFELIKKLDFSERGEFEISDLNNELIKTNSIN